MSKSTKKGKIQPTIIPIDSEDKKGLATCRRVSCSARRSREAKPMRTGLPTCQHHKSLPARSIAESAADSEAHWLSQRHWVRTQTAKRPPSSRTTESENGSIHSSCTMHPIASRPQTASRSAASRRHVGAIILRKAKDLLRPPGHRSQVFCGPGFKTTKAPFVRGVKRPKHQTEDP